MNNLSRLVVAMSILSFMACKKDASLNADDSIATMKRPSKHVAVPIKGAYVTTNERLSPPPMVLQRITGIGQASHLGEGKFIAMSTLNLTSPPPFNFSGTCTFFAANGDEFYTSFVGTSMPQPDGTLVVHMRHLIKGGTGRFAEASGTLAGHSHVDPTAPSAISTYEGTISY